ncbi:hypothetical protein GA0070607_5037 [Micromonospora coriariae]|uniref:DUF4878 domain-containing protein n=1 Tax=Micromonospora coriariae TaxID=285665 RepID=A0A1C4XBY7_9ACTN|nr:hypothetical protein [Micromonospora coriariae]SCF06063.1 hypothetical protein GA0070607_5037 [Micromonospora coriariae]
MSGRWGRALGILAIGLFLVVCYGCLTRSLSVWQIVALGTIAAFGAVVWTALTVTKAVRERGPAQATAAAYLDALVAADFTVAYQLLAEQRRQASDLRTFSELHSGGQRLTGYSVAGTTIVGPGQPRAEVQAQARFVDGEVAPLQLLLIRQADGQWRVAEWHTGERW